jgi:ABC-2 type transport system ATP-binding protein
VAAGRPHELTHAGGLDVETRDGVKRYPNASREDAPAIVAALVHEGADVYEVRLRRSTLEDVYLEAVDPARAPL